jgi:hypothetical protein
MERYAAEDPAEDSDRRTCCLGGKRIARFAGGVGGDVRRPARKGQREREICQYSFNAQMAVDRLIFSVIPAKAKIQRSL